MTRLFTRFTRLAALLVSTLLFSLTAAAQQSAVPLLPFTPVSGTLDVDGSAAYTFSAASGAVVSLAAITPDGDLDAALTVSDSSDRVIGAHDDRAFPSDTDPLLSALTLPRTDTYTVTVTSVGGTAGPYTLTLTPGFPTQAQLGFAGDWDAEGGSIDITPERIILTAEGARARTIAVSETTLDGADFYAQVDLIAVSSQERTWITGIVFRQSGTDYYLFAVNEQGLWRFSRIDGEAEEVIRDWTPHPALRPGDTAFTLGVLAIGTTFDFFYDGTFIGSNDDAALARPGALGVLAGTSSALSTVNVITYANWSVTLPDGQPIPDQVYLSNDGAAMMTALKRQFPALAAGTMRLTLPDSSVQYNRAGINRIGVGRGTTYGTFALGVTMGLDASALESAGCGVSVRTTGETDYTLAWFNRQGEYGTSRRTGDTFTPGLYGARAGFAAGEHHLLILAMENTLVLYLDGILTGSVTDDAGAGELGIAVVNFDPANTTCRARNLWVWSAES